MLELYDMADHHLLQISGDFPLCGVKYDLGLAGECWFGEYHLGQCQGDQHWEPAELVSASLIPASGSGDPRPNSYWRMWLFLCGTALENGGHVALFPVCLALLAYKCLGTVLEIQVANWNML